MHCAFWLALPVLAASLSLSRGDGPDYVLDKAPSKFAKSGELKVHYKSLGDGKTAVVFVHGWCCDHSVWRDQAAAFDGKVRMLFVDLPGYGVGHFLFMEQPQPINEALAEFLKKQGLVK